MKVHSNFTGPKSTKRLIAFSCATALASFAFIARPAFAEEAKPALKALQMSQNKPQLLLQALKLPVKQLQ